MPQHDYVIDNGSGQTVRLDFNAALQAIVTQNSGAVEPATKYAGQLWLDLSVLPDGVLRQRNQANTAWVAPLLPARFENAAADLSFGTRGTAPNGEWYWNSKADGSGTDVMKLSAAGLLTLGTGNFAMSTIVRRFYTSSGSPHTWTKPANLQYALIRGQGPGGSGSAAVATNATTYSFGSGGGGSAYGERLFDAAALPASLLITIAAPGAASSGAGLAGGTTTIAGTGVSLSLPGGQGGNQGDNTTGEGVIPGSGSSGNPTGFTLGIPGGSSGSCMVNIAACMFLSQAGNSHCGHGAQQVFTRGNGAIASVSGVGWGSGSGGCVNSPSLALKPSVAGQPSFVEITEFV